MQSVPLWEKVIDAIDGPGDGSEFDDTLRVLGGTGYGRFCVETGRLAEANLAAARGCPRAKPADGTWQRPEPNWNGRRRRGRPGDRGAGAEPGP